MNDNTDLNGLWLQPGFVEGIIADRRHFATLEQAYQHIFRRNLEYAVLLWNGIPVRLGYPDDLPAMVENIITLLDAVQHPDAAVVSSYVFRTPNLHTVWQVKTDPDIVTLAGAWHTVPGGYAAALNYVRLIHMPRLAFLYEWKLLLQQLIQALADAEVVLTTPQARHQVQTLHSLEVDISARGRWYQY